MPRGSGACGSVGDPARPAGEGGSDAVIVHVDMDAFFAAVEVLDRPELTGLPVIVGGTGNRGVVASCSYEARGFGVRSAMPMGRARRLCPSAVVLGGRYARYEEVSRQLRGVLTSITPLVEPIGLDEAFLDVTGALGLFGGAERIADELRARVRASTSLSCSVGIGRSKLIAKLASRAAKPTAGPGGRRPGPGVVVVGRDQELAFLHPMAVEALWGVGRATARRLHELGVESVGDLAAVPPDALARHFGRAHGLHLADLARGHDPSPVVADRAAKSVGHEETFGKDVFDVDELRRKAVSMAEAVASQLRASGTLGRTVTVKVRFSDFSLITRSHTLAAALDAAPAIAAVCGALLEGVDAAVGVRLLGVSMSGLQPGGAARQLAFDLEAGTQPPDVPGAAATAAVRAARLQEQWREVTAALDGIHQRFGRAAVGRASSVGPDGVEVRVRGSAQWGPAAEPGDGDR
jgi:DNA polymerase-4